MLARIDIDLDALRYNVREIAQYIAPARFAGVVKANAYGHGMLAVARELEELKVPLCVYSLDEAVALRDAGIESPVLVMGPIDPRRLREAWQAQTSIALWDVGAYAADVAGAAGNGERFSVNVKVDTGVSRLGFSPDKAPAAIATALDEPHLAVDSVFSHLASAEELDSPYTEMQLARFHRCVEPLLPRLRENPRFVRHIAASAAAMLWPQTRLEIARIGIAMYGLWASPATHEALEPRAPKLRPVLRFSTEIVAVREVSAGTSIGYGGAYRTPHDATIGVLPIGYAEGIPRAFSNRASFLVGGHRVPVVGRVCMNMTMVDLSGVPHVGSGSTVTLIGSDGDQEITADDWAQWAETINYEIMARLPSEIPRKTDGSPA